MKNHHDEASDGNPLPEYGTLDEIVEHYAYPGELPVLADMARMILAWGPATFRYIDSNGKPIVGRPSNALALEMAVVPLLDAIAKLMGAPPDEADPDSCRWSQIIDLAYGTMETASPLVATWRMVADLSDDEKWELLEAARSSKRRDS